MGNAASQIRTNLEALFGNARERECASAPFANGKKGVLEINSTSILGDIYSMEFYIHSTDGIDCSATGFEQDDRKQKAHRCFAWQD
jgi:hypothetical protein